MGSLTIKELEMLDWCLSNRDFSLAVDYYFREEITPKQNEIITAISDDNIDRLVISAYTQWGKSWAVSIGVLIYILQHTDKDILLLAPIDQQTRILRNYISEFLLRSERFTSMVDLELSGIERLKREVSQKRITFKNGCELRTLSAEGSAKRLMGWGGDLVIVDESCLIAGETHRQKISRMLGGHETAKYVEIGNPWDKDSFMYEHWTDKRFHRIHIPYQTGIEEGRVKKSFIDEQRKLLTPMEFRILYEAEFPEDSEDTLIRWEWIEKAETTPDKYSVLKKIMSLDVAEGGVDKTVLSKIVKTDKGTILLSQMAWHKADTMETAGKVAKEAKDFTPDELIVDATGVGKGVADRLEELDFPVIQLKVGSSSTRQPERFLNMKAQVYWALREMFEDGTIHGVSSNDLRRELRSIKYELSSSGKIKIIDSKSARGNKMSSGVIHSPDFADSLCYGCSDIGAAYGLLDDPDGLIF